MHVASLVNDCKKKNKNPQLMSANCPPINSFVTLWINEKERHEIRYHKPPKLGPERSS